MDGGKDLELCWLTPSIALSGRLPPERVAQLADECSIKRVIDFNAHAAESAERLRVHGIELLRLPVPEGQAPAPSQLDTGVHWAREALLSGGRVLLLSRRGTGRSALLACCLLVTQGLSPVEALRHVKQMRAQMVPSEAQLDAFLVWSRSWLRLAQRAQPRETLDSLSAVAAQPS